MFIGKFYIATCYIIFVVLAFSGCRTGLNDHIQASPDSEFSEKTERTTSEAYYAPAYYYYASSQLAIKTGQLEEAIWLMGRAVEFDPHSVYLKLELAELLTADQKNERALTLIEEILSRNPDHLAALILAGKIYQQRQEPERAKAVYERALSTNPTEQNIYIVLGRLYWDESDLENAERVFRLMADNIPDAYVALYFIGKVYVGQGKIEKAIDTFRKALSLDPGFEESRLELIELYKSQKQYNDVIHQYQELLVHNPGNYKAAVELAVYYHQQGQSEKGKKLLAEVGRSSQRDSSIIAIIIEAFIDSERYETAIWVLNGMLDGAPNSSELHYLIGAAYDGLAMIEPTLQHLIQVQPKSRFYANAVSHIALLYRQTQRLDQAVELIRQALQFLPEHIDFYYYLSVFVEEQGHLKQAEEILRKGLTIDSDNVRLSYQLGIVLDKMGKRQESIAAMKRVVSLSPDHAEALNYLGYTYAEMGIYLDEAEKLIRSALKEKPDNGYITDSLGWVFFKRGEYEKALQWLLKALTLLPGDPAILEHVGDVYQKMNRADQALIYYQRSLKAESDRREVLEEKIRSLRIQKTLNPLSEDRPNLK